MINCCKIFVLHLTCYIVGQVLLITGGWDGRNKLASTEIHVTGTNNWNLVGNLPRAVYGLREDSQYLDN